MSEIKRINPPQMADTSDYGFTQVVVVPSGSELVYIAGQGGADEKGNYGSFTELMEHAFASLQTALSAVGASPKDVVNSRIPLLGQHSLAPCGDAGSDLLRRTTAFGCQAPQGCFREAVWVARQNYHSFGRTQRRKIEADFCQKKIFLVGT